MKRENGFTLAEILGVVALLGLIALITIPAITNVMKKQKEKVYYDQLNQLVRASQNWGTDNKELLDLDLNGYCNSDGTWKKYELTLSDLQKGTEDVSYLTPDFTNPRTEENFEDTKVYVYKKSKSYLYCVDAPDCYAEGKYPASDEYKSTASNLCCNGEEFRQRLSECVVPDDDELIEPVSTIDSTDWKQSKIATTTFYGAGTSFINSSVEVITNVSAVACASMNGAEYLCDGNEVVLANGTLKANTWYQINESQVELTYNSNGILLTRTSNGTNYLDGNQLTVENIDTVAPTVSSLSGATATLSGYNTASLKLTAIASDVGSGIAKYEFYKVLQTSNAETLLGTSTTGMYTVINPANGYNYKVKVYDKVGLSSEKTLTESCSISTTGTCYSGTRTNIYTCTTGRQYSASTTSGCPTTTSATTCGSINCPSGMTQCGCGCCYSGGSTTTNGGYNPTTTRTTTKSSGSGSSDPCHCASICGTCSSMTGDAKASCLEACAYNSSCCYKCCGQTGCGC